MREGGPGRRDRDVAALNANVRSGGQLSVRGRQGGAENFTKGRGAELAPFGSGLNAGAARAGGDALTRRCGQRGLREDYLRRNSTGQGGGADDHRPAGV